MIIIIILTTDSTKGIVRSISLMGTGFHRIIVVEDRMRAESRLEGIKNLLSCRRPDKFGVLWSKDIKGVPILE